MTLAFPHRVSAAPAASGGGDNGMHSLHMAALRAAAAGSCAVGLAVFAAPALAQGPPPPPMLMAAPMACGAPATVSAAPAANNNKYTTIVVCGPRASKPAGEADWPQHIHWSQIARGNGAPVNNLTSNNVHMTIRSGVTIMADGLVDMRAFEVDGAIRLSAAGDTTLVVEEGAMIEFDRTPSYWLPSDTDRPTDGTEDYYSSGLEALNNHGALVVRTTGYGASTVTHNGVIDFNVRTGGSYGHYASNGNIIWVHQADGRVVSEGRHDYDITVNMGPKSIIRHVAGSDGGNGMYLEQNLEDGNIFVNLAEGSLLDVSGEGGRAVVAWVLSTNPANLAPDDNGVKRLTGDVIVDAKGTVRAAVRRRPSTNPQQGSGINAWNSGTGRVRVTSSGTVATVQAVAIYALALNAANEWTDDPETPDEIEGHLIDIAGGEVEARGGTAVYTWSKSADAAFSVRVREGATVRAQALTEEDYENGAITREQLGTNGNGYIAANRIYGWRGLDADGDGEIDSLEPILGAITMRGAATGSGDGAADRAIVEGTVEKIGGNPDDPAISMQRGGIVTVGANGVVKTSAGLAIAGGAPPPAEPGEDYEAPESDLAVTVAGRVMGDVRVLDDGALTMNVMAGGAVTGTIYDPQTPFTVASEASIGRILYDNGGAVTIAASGRIAGVETAGGAREAIRSAAGDLTVDVAAMATVTGDIRGDGDGDLDVDVSGTVEGGIFGLGGGEHDVHVKPGGAVEGLVHLAASTVTVDGSAASVRFDRGGTVAVGAEGRIPGLDGRAVHSAAGDLTVTVNGAVAGSVAGLGAGDLDVTVSGTVTGDIVERNAGNLKAAVSGTVTGDIAERGAGDLDVTVSGTVAGGVVGEGAGAHTVTVESSGAVAGTVHLPANVEMTISGGVGRVRYDNGGAVTINASGRITGLEIEGTREAIRSDAGDLAVTVHGTVTGNIEARGDGDLTVRVSEAGTVAGEIFGRGGGVHTVEIAEKARVLGTVHNPKSGTTISGAAGRVLFDNGGALTVAATGRIAGIGGEAIRADAGDLSVTVAKGGMVAGRIEGRGEGAMTVNVAGAVTGAIHGKGAGKHEVTVASGGMVTGGIVDMDEGSLVATVAGRLDGSIEERGAGDLTAAVTGTVTGDIRGAGAGAHTVAVQKGGAVAGTVRLPTSAMTVAGRVGRILYDNGGSVTVAGGGAVTGIDNDGTTEAIRSAAGDLKVDVAAMATVTGAIRGEGDGDLDVDVSGTVKGGIFGLGGGEHDVHVKSGGAVEGLIHLAASTVTVDGSAARVLFDRGGTVAVNAGGRLSGIDGSAVHSSAGDLTVMVNGVVTGSIASPDAGNLEVTVANALTGDIAGGAGLMDRLTVRSGAAFEGVVEAVEFIHIAGRAAGTLRVPEGNEIAVPAGGELVGAEDAQGRRVAIIAETGPLNLAVDGRVEGAVDATDADAASMVTVDAGGAIDGKVTLAGAGSSVAVDGDVQSVDVPRGAVTVGENGRIEEPVAGAVALTVKAAPDESDAEAVQRVGGGRIDNEATVVIAREGLPDRPLTVTPDGGIRVGPAPRHRVYEALPSLLLALNALPDFGGALASAGARGAAAAARYELAANGGMAAARTAGRGAWARLHAGGGDRRPASSSAGGAHDIRRYAFEAGMEGASGGNALVSLSVHHVRGEADTEGAESGGVEVSGTGARMAGAWFPAGGYYVGGQASATLYEADLTSADPQAESGVLKRDVSGRGYTVGAEAGRRFDVGRVGVTPRARVSWSRIDMSPFTDSAGERVALEGRSLKARAGVRVDAAALAGGVGGLFATADLERELSGTMRANAADMVLDAEAEATWLHLGVGGVHEWADGRFALRGGANYAAARNGNRDFGGSASFIVRF